MAATSPFNLENSAGYAQWRELKLARYPARVEDLVVEIKDPRKLTQAEHGAILDRVRRANMAIYISGTGSDPDKDIPRLLGRQFGLNRLDFNLLADDDGISPITVAEKGQRTEFIPYTNRPINWHTDGYYNPPERWIRAFLLHCVESAATGGENEFIPPRTDDSGVARGAETGPVFSIHPETGDLHMRYTARTKSIEWKQEPATLEAVSYIERLLKEDSPYKFRGRLESGMGFICNNVPHTRTGFNDDDAHHRLLYRARYFDRIADSSVPAIFSNPQC
jgi:alpha-ketoglutarate-dependent taurine dioxygenase